MYGYGTFTLYGSAVPGEFSFHDLDKRLPTTSPSLSIWDSACPVPFSFATTHGISLISIPPPTKMLQFGGFPIASRLFPKKQEVPFSHLRIQDILASPRSLSQLVTTFIGTRAERSPSWVVASHVCIPHHASNPSVSNSCQFGFHRRPPPLGWSSSALPLT